jgi:methylated-DNA-[protein]-cysteine S-methyltransferase
MRSPTTARPARRTHAADKERAMPTEPSREAVVADPIGLVLHWECGRIVSMDLAWSRDLEPGQAGPATAHGAALAEALERYLAGEPASWPELPLDWDRPAPFHRKVLRALMDLPWGAATTYGGLAALAGNRRAARAVGQAMGANPWPLVVPCHRVLAGGGRLGGFGGQGLPMKRFLLDLEGIPYKDLI